MSNEFIGVHVDGLNDGGVYNAFYIPMNKVLKIEEWVTGECPAQGHTVFCWRVTYDIGNGHEHAWYSGEKSWL